MELRRGESCPKESSSWHDLRGTALAELELTG
jgi:hypothetical protein